MAPLASFSFSIIIFELHGRFVHLFHHVLTDRHHVLSIPALASICGHFAILFILFSLVQCQYRRHVLTQFVPGKPGNMLTAIGTLSC